MVRVITFLHPIKERLKEDLFLIGLILLALLARFYTIEALETGGDAISKWMLVGDLLKGQLNQPWDHHAARVSMLLPALIIKSLFGSHIWVYYLPTLLMFITSVFLIYKIAQQLSGNGCALVACSIFIFHPELTRSGAQFLPGVYSSTYILASYFFTLKFVEKERLVFLYSSAVFMFLAYLAKAPNVFFIPGILSTLWIYTRKKQHLLYFILPLIGMYFVEHLVYWLTLNAPLGRVSIVQSYHLGTVPLQFQSLYQLLARFAFKSQEWNLLFISTFWCSILTVFFFRSKEFLSLFLMAISFLFFTTFTLSSIDPITPLVGFNTRYLVVVIPFLSLLVGMGLSSLISEVPYSQYLRIGIERPFPFQLSSSLSYGLLVFVMIGAYQHYYSVPFSKTGLARAHAFYQLVNAHFYNALPIVAPKNRVRELKNARVYLNSSLFDYPEIKQKKIQNTHYFYMDNATRKVSSTSEVNCTALLIRRTRRPWKFQRHRFEKNTNTKWCNF